MFELGVAVLSGLGGNESCPGNRRSKPTNNINIMIESDREQMKDENLTYRELAQSKADFWAGTTDCPTGWDTLEHHL